MENQDELERAKLNLETSQLPWKELLRHFASGSVIAVSDALDLVEVALQMSKDNKEQFMRWLTEGSVSKVSDLQAKNWLDADAQLWTVVVKPWILVQERAAAGGAQDTTPRTLH
jgi:hypothetical protein